MVTDGGKFSRRIPLKTKPCIRVYNCFVPYNRTYHFRNQTKSQITPCLPQIAYTCHSTIAPVLCSVSIILSAPSGLKLGSVFLGSWFGAYRTDTKGKDLTLLSCRGMLVWSIEFIGIPNPIMDWISYFPAGLTCTSALHTFSGIQFSFQL